MCEPATIGLTTGQLAMASTALAVVGTGMTVYGQMQAGKAAQSQANYQAQVAANNKIIADRQAADALDRGKNAEKAHRIQVAQLAGRQRAVLAGNGVVLDDGTALDITSDTMAMGELDALTIRSNAQREAYAYEVQGMGFQADAGLYAARGQSAASAGQAAGFSSLLSGAGSVADKWYGFKKEGAF